MTSMSRRQNERAEKCLAEEELNQEIQAMEGQVRVSDFGLLSAFGASAFGFRGWIHFSNSRSLGTFPGCPAVPESGKDQDDRTTRRKQNEEWGREHKPGNYRGTSREATAQVTIKRAGLSAANALLQNCR